MLHSGGTLPKMSFAPMKEELSRTLPTKSFTSLGESYHERLGENCNTQSTRNNGDEIASTTVGKNSSDKDRKSSERPIGRDRRDRSDQSNLSLDSSLTLMDETVNSSILNRSSLLEALKQEKESRPESYWRV